MVDQLRRSQRRPRCRTGCDRLGYRSECTGLQPVDPALTQRAPYDLRSSPGKQKTSPERGFRRCRRRDSNPRHADYDSAALTS